MEFIGLDVSSSILFAAIIDIFHSYISCSPILPTLLPYILLSLAYVLVCILTRYNPNFIDTPLYASLFSYLW
jgi:hypothetical protein